MDALLVEFGNVPETVPFYEGTVLYPRERYITAFDPARYGLLRPLRPDLLVRHLRAHPVCSPSTSQRVADDGRFLRVLALSFCI